MVVGAVALAIGLGGLARHLTQVDEAEVRLQTPTPPFPYQEREVALEGGAGTLAGTLMVPEGAGPHPAALLVSGAGAQDRNAVLSGHERFVVLGDHLARRGIAVLRLDDRGVGGSEGDLLQTRLDDLAEDASRALDWLARQPEIAADRVGLVGGSEGGLTSILTADRRPGTAFAVLLSTPGLPSREIFVRQQLLLGRALGMSESDLARVEPLMSETLSVIESRRPEEEKRRRLREILRQLEELSPGGASVGATGAGAELRVALALSPSFQSLLAVDPRPALRRLTLPVLALSGDRDMQVEAEPNVAEIEAALTESGNPDFEVAILPGLNHLLQPAETGLPSEYGEIALTYDPAALSRISDWLLARFGPDASAGHGGEQP